MFIGHFAPAFAAAAISPRAPKLGILFLAGQIVDWAFFTFAIFGIEKMRIDPEATVMVPFDLYHIPYTHSLLATGFWATSFALIVLVATRNQVAALLSGLVVASHWLLDLLTHRPDLTLAGAPPAYGLGLWNYPFIAMPFELGITLGAFIWYLRSSRGPIGQPLILMAALLLMQIYNWFAPAPTQADIGLYLTSLLAFAISTGLAWWVGQNRWHKRARG